MSMVRLVSVVVPDWEMAITKVSLQIFVHGVAGQFGGLDGLHGDLEPPNICCIMAETA